MDIQLVSLEMEGFGSFRKRTKIQFPRGNAIMLLSGQWKGSGVSSGSGKTTILKAIAICLGIGGGTLASLKNWDSKKMFVKLTIQIGPDMVEIVMDPKLSLIINGEQHPGLTKGPREKLMEMLGTNEDMLEILTYRKQRAKGTIVRATDSQLKEYLTGPLKLGEVELATEQFTQSANKIVETIKMIKRDVEHYETTLPQMFVSDTDLTSAHKAYADAHAEWSRLGDPKTGASITEQINALRAEQSNLSKELDAVQQEVRKVNDLNYSAQSRKTENGNIKRQILTLQEEVKTLEQNACPTCRREWEAAKEHLERKNRDIDSLIERMKVNIEYIKNAEPILASVPALEAKRQEISSKISALSAQQNTLNAQLGELSAPHRLAESAVRSASANYQTLEQKRKNYDKQLITLNEHKAKLAAQEEELAIEQGAASLLGRSGFLGSIFDEILADIEVRTNDMLSYFPNARHFTVTISSNKLVKTKGTTKKEISVTISNNGTDVDLDDNCSGGQQGAIELCSDLAAAEAIRARSGCAVQWTGLDEVMEGLGPDEKKAVIEMIKDRVKGLVLMIDHATEIKESFDKVVSIEYDGRESYVAPA